MMRDRTKPTTMAMGIQIRESGSLGRFFTSQGSPFLACVMHDDVQFVAVSGGVSAELSAAS